MCGRFVQRYTWDDIQDLYGLPDGSPRNLPAHFCRQCTCLSLTSMSPGTQRMSKRTRFNAPGLPGSTSISNHPCSAHLPYSIRLILRPMSSTHAHDSPLRTRSRTLRIFMTPVLSRGVSRFFGPIPSLVCGTGLLSSSADIRGGFLLAVPPRTAFSSFSV